MFDLIGAETDLGVAIDGANEGPKLIMDYFNKKKINKIYIKKPNIIKQKNKNNKAKNIDEIIKYNEILYKQVNYSLNNYRFPITIGGDHSIAIASSLAAANNNKEVGIIWIDAHTDFNTLETTETGNIHGVPLASICGLCNKLTNNLTNNFISMQKCVIVGARSIDKKEFEVLKKYNIKVFTTNDIRILGVDKVMEEAFKIAGNMVHISYDLDIIDPEISPGVSVPEINGIFEKEAYQIMEYLVKERKKITSLDIVEYNPKFDYNERTLSIAINLINKFIN